MKITDLLMSEGIELNGQVSSKAEAIDKMVDLMAATGKISDKEAYRAEVLRRGRNHRNRRRHCNSPWKVRCSKSSGTGSHGSTGRRGLRISGWRAGRFDFSDCSAEYQG